MNAPLYWQRRSLSEEWFPIHHVRPCPLSSLQMRALLFIYLLGPGYNTDVAAVYAVQRCLERVEEGSFFRISKEQRVGQVDAGSFLELHRPKGGEGCPMK